MNHEIHEIHERPRRMRVLSPLPQDVEDVVSRTIGCAITVHKALGPGFLESIYVKAMCIELSAQGMAYEREKPIAVVYRGIALEGQRLDLVIGGNVIVELKAVAKLEQIHRAQVISYLHTVGLRVGLLINFRVPVLPMGIQRIVV